MSGAYRPNRASSCSRGVGERRIHDEEEADASERRNYPPQRNSRVGRSGRPGAATDVLQDCAQPVRRTPRVSGVTGVRDSPARSSAPSRSSTEQAYARPSVRPCGRTVPEHRSGKRPSSISPRAERSLVAVTEVAATAAGTRVRHGQGCRRRSRPPGSAPVRQEARGTCARCRRGSRDRARQAAEVRRCQ